MRFTGPLRKKRDELCLKDILEIEISGNGDAVRVKTIKDRDSRRYPFERLFDWKQDKEFLQVELMKSLILWIFFVLQLVGRVLDYRV